MALKRIVSTALAAVMALSLMAGCTKNEGTQASSTGTQTTNETSAQKTPDAKPAIRYLHGYHNSVDLITKNGEDLNNNRISKAHNENTGINVQWEMLPKSDADTKIAMAFSSGDVPDLITLTKDNAFKYAAQGAIAPLDELISKYCPNYLSITPQDIQDAVKSNGESIAFAMLGEGALEVASSGTVVRRDIMDELGLKDPKTLDEYVALMKTVKEKKNMIPIESSDVLLQPVMGAFGVAGRTVVKNGKLEFSYIQPEFKEYLAFVKGMYDQGLIDREFALVKDNSQKLLEGRAFAMMSDWIGIAINKTKLADKFPQAKLDHIPYPEGKNGMKGSIQTTLYGILTCIPAKAKNKEAAAQFVNYMGSEKAGLVQDYGIEGVDYKVENGKIVQTLEEQTNVTWKICYQTIVRADSFPRRLKLKGFDPEYNRQAEFSKGAIITEPTLVAPPIEKYDGKYADLKKHVDEYTTKVAMGAASLDDFDRYVQEFNAKGGKEAIDAMNEWYTKK